MIGSLTDEQRATFAPYVADRVRADLTGGRLDQAARDAIEAGIRGCYAAAGLPWPDRLVWVPSPRIGEAAAQTAAATVVARREEAAATAHPAAHRTWAQVRRRIGLLLRWTVNAVPVFAMFVGMGAFLSTLATSFVFAVATSVRSLFNPEAGGAGRWWVGAVLGAAAGALVGASCCFDVWRSVLVNDARAVAVRRLAVGTDEIEATGSRIRTATVDAVAARLDAVLAPAVADLVRHEVDRPVAAATVDLWAVLLGDRLPAMTASADLVGRRARQAATAAVGAGLVIPPPRPNPPMADWWAPDTRSPSPPAAHHRDGRVAGLLWWRRHGDVELDGDSWDRLHAYAEAGRVRWWAHPDFVVVSDCSVEIYRQLQRRT